MYNWNEQRQKLLLDRYALKSKDGTTLENTPEEIWGRVSEGLARKTAEATEFYKAMENFRFVPGGRVLAGVGADNLTTFFNCHVIPVKDPDGAGNDSRQALIKTTGNLIEIACRGGGVGVNWSTLRPTGAYVKGVHGVSSGVTGWVKGVDAFAQQVKQGGSREAALMFMLEDWHPDILGFVDLRDQIKSANLSIGMSDRFMEAVKRDQDWPLVFPDTTHPDYNAKWDGDISVWKGDLKTYKVIRARDLWERICRRAWESGNPGIVWLDRYNKLSNTWYCEKIRAVNPCGEQGLGEWGVCNLGALNLSSPGLVEDEEIFNLTISRAIRMLDRIIDVNVYLNKDMEHGQKQIRRVGLGTMGLADLLLKKELRYGSKESLEYISSLYEKIRDQVYLASVELSKELGPAPAFEWERFKQGAFVKTLPEHVLAAIEKHGLRNLVLLTQAPTGSTSILAGASSGIEPIFKWTYKRTDNTGEHIIEHPFYTAHKEFDYMPSWGVTAHELKPEEHVAVQATIQRFVDSSISKTVNAPKDHTIEEARRTFMTAYDVGCKGVTYYREGSRSASVLEDVVQKVSPRNRPKKLKGETVQWETPLGKLYFTLNKGPYGEPFETFCQLGKNGSDILAFTEALGRLMSLCLRCGVGPEHIIHHLHGIGGPSHIGFGVERVRSVPDALAQALKHLLGSEEEEAEKTGNLCPKCGANQLVREEGCAKCGGCGHSIC